MSPDRKNGRPRKVQGSRVPYEELDRILVFGEASQFACLVFKHLVGIPNIGQQTGAWPTRTPELAG